MITDIKRKNMIKKIIITWICIFVVSFIFELYLESKQLVDSIGLWYTLYVSTVFSFLILGFVLIVYLLIKWKDGWKDGKDGGQT